VCCHVHLPPSCSRSLAVPPPAPLRDQLGRADGLERHRGETVVALVVTAKRLRALRGWQLELEKRLAGVSYLRVADIPADPRVDHERVAARLRERVPDQVPIGIDLARSWATTYGLDTAEVNLLVFDASGELAARFRGRRSEALVDQVAAAVERLQRAERGASS
jgi:hypothetical protein